MSQTVLITRPEPDASYFADMLRRKNKNSKIIKCPLTEIIFIPAALTEKDEKKDIDGVQLVAATSANALRADLPPEILSLPVFTVGEATALAARKAGFQEIMAAENDLASLARLITSSRRSDEGVVLYLTGRDRAGDLSGSLAPRGFSVRMVELYEARALAAFPAAIIDSFRREEIGAVSFFSRRSAELFARLVIRHNLRGHLGGMRAICLAANVAEALAGLDFGEILVARARTAEAMCDLVFC